MRKRKNPKCNLIIIAAIQVTCGYMHKEIMTVTTVKVFFFSLPFADLHTPLVIPLVTHVTLDP